MWRKDLDAHLQAEIDKQTGAHGALNRLPRLRPAPDMSADGLVSTSSIGSLVEAVKQDELLLSVLEGAAQPGRRTERALSRSSAGSA